MICFFYNQNVDLLKLSPIKQTLKKFKKWLHYPGQSNSGKKNVIVVHINPKAFSKKKNPESLSREGFKTKYNREAYVHTYIYIYIYISMDYWEQ